MKQLHEIWIDWCHLTRDIEFEFGVPVVLAFLIGEKFLIFLEAAEDDSEFRTELPAFVAEIKMIFEPWQLTEYLAQARETESFDLSDFDDDSAIEMERRFDLRRRAADLLLIERAKAWLLAE